MACTDPDALEAVRLTGHTRFLELLDPEHPDYAPSYFEVVKRIVAGGSPSPARPSLLTQAGNLAAAVGRAIADPRVVPDAVKLARLDACLACEYEKAGRCQLCTCYLAIKTALAAESCPDNPPRLARRELADSGGQPQIHALKIGDTGKAELETSLVSRCRVRGTALG